MNTDIDPKPTIGRASAESELLIKFLAAAEIGQVYTYADLKAACKADVQERNTVLQTAKRTLLKPPHNMVFGTIMGVGIKRLSDEEIPDEGANAVKRSRRIARNGYRKMQVADPSKMLPETRIKHVTTQTILGLFNGSGSRRVKSLAEQAARSSGKLEIGDVASLFKK